MNFVRARTDNRHSAIVAREVRTHLLGGINVCIPHGALALVTGSDDAARNALVEDTIYGRALMSLQSAEVSSRDLHVTHRLGFEPRYLTLSGLLPPIHLSKLWKLYEGSELSLLQMFGLDGTLPRLLSRFAHGECETCKERLIRPDMQQAVNELSQFPEQSRVLAGVHVHPTGSSANRKRAKVDKIALLRLLESLHARRVIVGDDLQNIDSLSDASFPSKELVAVLDTFSLRGDLRSRLSDAVQYAKSFGYPVSVVRIMEGGRLVDRRWHVSSEDLFLCPRCGRTSALGQDIVEPPTGVTLYLGDLPVERLLFLPLSEITRLITEQMERSPERLDAQAKILMEEFGAISRYAAQLGLNDLPIQQRVEELSSGERLLALIPPLVAAELRETLLVASDSSDILPPEDLQLFVAALKRFVAQGNTVILSDRDGSIGSHADHVIELGTHFSDAPTPKRMRNVAQGEIPVQYVVRDSHREELVPLKQIVAVTGRSGSGKSTLLRSLERIWPSVDWSSVDWSSVSWSSADRTSADRKARRGNQAASKEIVHLDGLRDSSRGEIERLGFTVLGTLGISRDIAKLFAEQRAARQLGLSAESFMLDRRKSRCPACNGTGVEIADTDLQERQEILCGACFGGRFPPDVEAVQFSEHSIAKVYALSVSQALSLFAERTEIVNPLLLLQGFGYSKQIGAPLRELSAAALARVRLARGLSRKSFDGTLFLLDQMLIGLSRSEVQSCMDSLRRTVARGASVLIVSHDESVLSSADTILELSQ